MAHLNLSYDELAAIISMAAHLANADGHFSEEEMAAIVKGITDRYNFDGKEDLFKQYLDSANEMSVEKAVELLSGIGDEEKQFASNLFVSVIAADGNLDEDEKSYYFALMDACQLPDHNLTAEKETESTSSSLPATFPVIQYKSVFGLYLDGEVLYPQFNEDIRNKIFELYEADTLTFWRTSEGLDFLNSKIHPEGVHLVMIFDKNQAVPNKIGTLLAGEEVYGPILFAWEDDKKALYGFGSKEDIKYLLELLDTLAEGKLLVGKSNNSSLSQKNLQAALTKLENL